MFNSYSFLVNLEDFSFSSRYRTNFKDKIGLLESEKLFEWGAERNLLLSEIDEAEFYTFLNEFQTFLKTIIKKLL